MNVNAIGFYYSSFLDDDDFDCLPDDSKLLYFCLLPFASRRANKIRLELTWLHKKLPIKKKISMSTLQPLIDKGFIECYHDDSNGIDDCKHNATPETETEQSRDKEETETDRRFTPPSLSEITSLIQERGYTVEPNSFLNFYASKGWMVGRNKMKDWRAALAGWESRGNGPKKKTTAEKMEEFHNDRP